MSSFLDLNGNCVTLTGLKNKITDAFENDATVTVTIKDAAGATLVAAQAMPYVADSNGVYQTVITGSVSLGDRGDIVTVFVDGVTSGGFLYNAEGEVRIYDRPLKGSL